MSTLSALLGSRKFWVGTLTIAATVGAVVLRVVDKIPADALVPTIAAITATGLTVIGSIAWEDAAAKGAGGGGAPSLPTGSKDAADANVGGARGGSSE